MSALEPLPLAYPSSILTRAVNAEANHCKSATAAATVVALNLSKSISCLKNARIESFTSAASSTTSGVPPPKGSRFPCEENVPRNGTRAVLEIYSVGWRRRGAFLNDFNSRARDADDPPPAGKCKMDIIFSNLSCVWVPLIADGFHNSGWAELWPTRRGWFVSLLTLFSGRKSLEIAGDRWFSPWRRQRIDINHIGECDWSIRLAENAAVAEFG